CCGVGGFLWLVWGGCLLGCGCFGGWFVGGSGCWGWGGLGVLVGGFCGVVGVGFVVVVFGRGWFVFAVVGGIVASVFVSVEFMHLMDDVFLGGIYVKLGVG
ncbi:hypothetical protein, partial [Pseudomonas syringae group genomosp. 7]|uniref:hypothetical protein n=1 Tax=Pseudomonas syringae group genomosp. 7 TaxID=251699 RepID=UPI0037704D34